MKIKYLVPVVTLIVVGIIPAAVSAQTASVKSVYTDLNKTCRIVVDNELDFVKRCRGTAGYDLLAGLYDERFNVTVVNSAKKKFDQDYANLFERNFSDYGGGKAEWRVRTTNGKTVPFALIVRIGVQQDAMVPEETSYLAVSKISGHQICVTDKILPGPDQNLRAREAADSSAKRPCLQ